MTVCRTRGDSVAAAIAALMLVAAAWAAWSPWGWQAVLWACLAFPFAYASSASNFGRGSGHSLRKLPLISCVLLPFPALGNDYTIVDLGASYSSVGINDSGTVAGEHSAFGPRAARYLGGKWRNLSPQSQAAGINQTGDMVGTASKQHIPTLWRASGKALGVAVPGGSTEASVSGMNDKRKIIGTYYSKGSEDPHCFVWKEGSESKDSGLMEHGLECRSAAINESAQITGAATTDGEQNWRAFLWQKSKFTDLGLLPGTLSSWGLALNNTGTVVGAAELDFDHSRAFLWNGSMIDLDQRGEYGSSAATAINDLGNIVGWALISGNQFSQAVRFAASQVVSLSSEVSNIGNWILVSATSINNGGVIVGNGYRGSDGVVHAFELIPN